MKVIYDISVLGVAHYNARAATGINRVIANLALSLDENPQCDLVIFAGEHEELTFDYLQANPQFARLPYARSKFDRAMEESLSYLDNAIFKPRILKMPTVRLPLRALRIATVLLNQATKSSETLFRNNPLSPIDIFHATLYPPPASVCEQSRIKKFQTIYDLIPLTRPQWFSSDETELLEQVVGSLGSVDHVLAISQATKDDLCNYCGLDPARVTVTPLAANREVFYPSHDATKMRRIREKYGLPDAPYVLSLATLEPRKNTEHLVRCFADMVHQQNVSELHLVLTGSKGWQYDAIFERIEEAKDLKGRIIVTGRVDDEDLAELYSNALMFAYPSLYEGFGLPPLEAMQCGTPVVTSNVSSLPEVVGDAGLTVAPTDKDALSQSLYDLYRDEALRRKLCAQGLQRAAQFSWERCAQDTINAYQNALNR